MLLALKRDFPDDFRVIDFETLPRCQKAGPPRRLGPGRGLATSLRVDVGDLRTKKCA